MLGCGVKQEVLATEETPQALPQASFNSQENIAYCRQQQQAFSSLVFPARYSADAPLIFCFYTTQKRSSFISVPAVGVCLQHVALSESIIYNKT